MTFTVAQRRVIPGINRFLPAPCVVLAVALGDLAEWPTERLGRGYRDRVRGLLAALPKQLQPVPWFAPSLEELLDAPGYTLAHLLERMALHLQRLAGEAVSAGVTRPDGPAGFFLVAYEYGDTAAGPAAWRAGLGLLLGALPEQVRQALRIPADFDPAPLAKRYLALARGRAPGADTSGRLVRAAEGLGIPVIRRDGGPPMFQIGHGVHRRLVQHGFTDRTGFVQSRLVADRAQVRAILHANGIPVPAQAVADSALRAEQVAAKIGFPVIVRPTAGGQGTFGPLATAAQVRKAWSEAARHGGGVLVEKHVEGRAYRLLVVEGRLIAAALCTPGRVVGDGVRTVRELVEAENENRGTRGDHRALLAELVLDGEAAELLRRQELAADSIPEAGRTVRLRAAASIGRGGTAADVTPIVHADNKALAERAARILGLDPCGIELVTPDIARPVAEAGGAVRQVASAPGLRAHILADPGRDLAREIVQSMFPAGGRIPTAAVTGTNGKTTTCRMLAHILRHTGRRTGVATTAGIWIDERRVMAGDLATLIGGRVIVSDPSVEAAVVELARKGIINFGVPFADCDVAALLNVEDDHVGVDGVATVEELAAVKALVLARADKAAVLNADHPLVMAQRPVCRAGRIILVSESPSSPEAARHIAEGGTAVSLETRKGKEFVSVFAGRAKPRPLVEAAAIPATRSGRLRFNVTNAMFAAALALGLEIPEEAIGSALRGFEATLDSDPGRFNVFDGLPFTAVLDFAHNPHGIAAVCDGVDAIAAKGRKIVVMCNLGNRHLRHIEPGAARLARSFDIFLCSRNKRRCAQNPELAGKPADEVPRLIGEALRRHGVGGDRIETFTEERDAVDRAFAIARPGDFLLIAAHEFDYLGAKVEELRRALADAGR